MGEPSALTIVSAIFIALVVGWALRSAAREHPFEKGELWRCCVQFGLALACGAPVWFTDGLEREGRLYGTLIAGVGGQWLIMKAYTRLRYGRGAKFSMDPNAHDKYRPAPGVTKGLKDAGLID